MTPTRRAVMRLLAGWAALLGAPGRGMADPIDRGIGGTGVMPDPPSDRGIGGTGVLGTIRGFGSILVNDLHIAYPSDVRVTVDEALAGPGDLRIGHVVHVLAERADDRFETQHIAVVHEVVGPVERVVHHRLVVLGQDISTEALDPPQRWRTGQRVAISGLRRPDGVVVASLIEPSRSTLDRVVGTVVRAKNGRLSIGRLRLASVDAALIGQRAILSGHHRHGRFKALSSSSELSAITGSATDRYSIEAYVERSGNSVALGSGLPVQSINASDDLPDRQVVRAVLTARAGRTGFVVESIRASSSTGSSYGPGAHPGPHGREAPQGLRPQGRSDGFGNAPGGIGGSVPGPGGALGAGGPGAGGPGATGFGSGGPGGGGFGGRVGGAPGGFGGGDGGGPGGTGGGGLGGGGRR